MSSEDHAEHASADKPLVCSVVVNFRSPQETIDCVTRLEHIDYESMRVIVVDNHSEDDSVDRIRTAKPQAVLVASDRNAGYGDGCNQGIRKAREMSAKYVWIVTPDVRVQPGSLSPLVQAMESDERLGACGPVIVAGKLAITKSLVHETLGFKPEHEYQEAETEDVDYASCTPSDYVDGCAILLRMDMLEEIGLIREDFFLYFEETELCLRARDHGWGVAIVGDSLVTTRDMSEERNGRDFYMVRNSILLSRIRNRYVYRTVRRHLRETLDHAVRTRTPIPIRYGYRVIRGIRAGLSKPLVEVPRL